MSFQVQTRNGQTVLLVLDDRATRLLEQILLNLRKLRISRYNRR